MEKLYDIWARRNPEWETRFEESIMKTFSDYGKGNSQFLSSRGKIYGAGYEMFIIAFFIGLYFDQRRPLVEDKDKRKKYGQAIQYWGNIETRGIRQTYGNIRQYIFAALVARTDIDFIELEKGSERVTPASVVRDMMTTMEEYANWGFYYMNEKLDDPNYFFKDRAFFKEFLQFFEKAPSASVDGDEDVPESLD